MSRPLCLISSFAAVLHRANSQSTHRRLERMAKYLGISKSFRCRIGEVLMPSQASGSRAHQAQVHDAGLGDMGFPQHLRRIAHQRDQVVGICCGCRASGSTAARSLTSGGGQSKSWGKSHVISNQNTTSVLNLYLPQYYIISVRPPPSSAMGLESEVFEETLRLAEEEGATSSEHSFLRYWGLLSKPTELAHRPGS